MTIHESASEDETIAIGRTLGESLSAGSVVLLEGPLGAGKTAFARGMAEGLGCSGSDISSPTFTIVQQYRGNLEFQHVDLYRLTPREAQDLSLEELSLDGVMAVEWPDRWETPPDDAIRVRLEWIADGRRRITIERPIRPGSSALLW